MKKLFALLIPALLTAPLASTSALALGGGENLTQTRFGSCTIYIHFRPIYETAFISVVNPPALGKGTVSWWSSGVYRAVADPVNETILAGCVSGSSPSEFTITYNNGAEAGSTLANDDGMGLTFSFRGSTYDYRLIGQTNTSVSASPDTTTFPPAPDLTPPTVTLGALTGVGLGTYTSAITLSEPAGNGTVFDASDLTVGNGSVTAFTGNGTNFTATIEPTANGTVTLNVAANRFTDTAGNQNTAATQVSTIHDSIEPRVTSIKRKTPASKTTDADKLIFTVTFSETVFFAEDDDFTAIGTTATIESVTGSGAIYDVTVSGGDLADLNGTVQLDFAPGTITDTSGNAIFNYTPTGANESYQLVNDSTAPAVTLGALTATGSGTYTSAITLSEAAGNGTAFEQADLTVGNGSVTSLTGSGTSFTATITPNSDGNVTLDAPANGFTDAAGNQNTAATQVSINHDGNAPTVTLGPLTATGSGTYTSAITLSEAAGNGTAFEQADLTVGNGTATLSGSGTNFIATITPTSDGNVTLDVAANRYSDAAGNPNTAAIQVSTNHDGTAPTVTLSPLTKTGHRTYTSSITLSEPAGNGTIFDANDLNVDNGKITSLTGSGTNFTATIKATDTGEMRVHVESGRFKDAAGNDNQASSTISIIVDATRETNELINNVLGHNARMILQNQPKLKRRLDRFKNRVSSTGTVSAFGVSISNSGLPFDAKLNRESGSFSFSLNKARQKQEKAKVSVDPFALVGAVSPETRVETAHNAFFKAPASTQKRENVQDQSHLMGYVPPSGQTKTHPQPASDFIAPLKYDAWIEASFGQQSIGDSKAKYAIIHAGMDYLVTSNLLLGLGAQLDWANYDSQKNNAKADGFGFMVGPYLTSKLSDSLYVDARLAWGQSHSDISPLGTYEDELTTNRILATFAVIGDFDWNAIRITPKLRLSYFREESDAYVDKLGFAIQSSQLETGTLEFGPSFEKSFHMTNGLTLTPNLSLDGVWTFAENASNGNVTNQSGEGIRARLGAGLNVSTQNNLNLTFSGLYDGIGEDDYEAYSGTVRLSKQW